MLLAPGLQLAGERAIQLHQVVRPLHHRHDHGDQPVHRRARPLGGLGARLHQRTGVPMSTDLPGGRNLVRALALAAQGHLGHQPSIRR